MTLPVVLNAFGLVAGATPTKRLPTDATLDQAFADEVARNAVARDAAHAFWDAGFAALGEDPFGTADTPALRLGRELADEDLATTVPGRGHLVSAEDRVSMVRDAGCLVSLDEIARAITIIADGDSLMADVLAFDEAARGVAGPMIDFDAVARGVRGCRELYDAGRRLRFAVANATSFGITAAEALALHRQEGALAITPPEDSLLWAPLIDTDSLTCRTARVTLDDPLTERPGFSLVVPLQAAPIVADNDASKRFEVMRRNLLVTGGLDAIVSPALGIAGGDADELVQFFATGAFAVPRPADIESIDVSLTRQVSDGQGRMAIQMLFGLLMLRLEAGPTPTAGALLGGLRAQLDALMAAHRVEQRTVDGRKDLFLLGDLDGTDIELVLQIQTSWYASRTRLHTLAARVDRTAARRAAPRLSPFLSYLRFHTNDAIFVGILLRTILRLTVIRNRWTTHPEWGTALPDALAASSFDAAEAATIGANVAAHWAPNVGTLTTWRNIGLLDEIRAAGGAPAWLPAVPHPRGPILTRTAEIAAELVDAIIDQDLMDVLHAALSLTPIQQLQEVGVLAGGPRRRMTLAKAHSFERLRIAYAAAMGRAGV